MVVVYLKVLPRYSMERLKITKYLSRKEQHPAHIGTDFLKKTLSNRYRFITLLDFSSVDKVTNYAPDDRGSILLVATTESLGPNQPRIHRYRATFRQDKATGCSECLHTFTAQCLGGSVHACTC